MNKFLSFQTIFCFLVVSLCSSSLLANDLSVRERRSAVRNKESVTSFYGLASKDRKVISDIKDYRKSLPEDIKTELHLYHTTLAQIKARSRKLYNDLSDSAKEALTKEAEMKSELSRPGLKVLNAEDAGKYKYD